MSDQQKKDVDWIDELMKKKKKNDTAVTSVKDWHGCNECHTRRRIRL